MEPFIERTLQSVLQQTYQELEIIVIEDGSTDGTAAIVKRLASGNDRIRLVSTPNSGVAEARNLGTRMATTPYVAYLDADDIWHPTKIEKQVASLAGHGHAGEWAASYTLYRMIDDADAVILNGVPSAERGAFFERHLEWNPVGNGSSLLVRRDAALEVGGFNPSYARAGIGGAEDFEFQLKLLRSFSIELVREYLVGYRIHDTQMSSNIQSMRLSRIAVLENILAADDIDPDLRTRVMAQVHLGAARGFFEARDWGRTLRYLWRAVRFSPADSAHKFGRFLKAEYRHLATRAPGAKPDPRGPHGKRARFADFAPEDGIDNHRDISARYLASLAATRARSVSRPPSLAK